MTFFLLWLPALLLLYDVTNKQSYDNIRAWLGEIREYAQDDVVIMLLGECAPRVKNIPGGHRLDTYNRDRETRDWLCNVYNTNPNW